MREAQEREAQRLDAEQQAQQRQEKELYIGGLECVVGDTAAEASGG
jgi:hypothetical protein